MDADSGFGGVWSRAKRHIKEAIRDAETYRRWIEPIVPLGNDNGTAVLGVSDEFTSDWIHGHFEEMIRAGLHKASGAEYRIRLETGHFSEQPSCDTADAQPTRSAHSSHSGHVPHAGQSGGLAPNCNPLFTFSNFVVGPENRIAYAAAMGMVESSKSALSANPLFVYSRPGLGKTHLIQAVANEVKKLNRKADVEYLTCEELMNHYVDALRTNKHWSFRNRFRKLDYLLVDDIEFLAKTDRLQEEFFNTFNSLYNENSKILLTSDKSPNEMTGIETRLISRFSSGLTVEIEPFSEETRLAVLKKKQENHLVKFDDEVLLFIARNIVSDVRALEGALLRLVAFSAYHNSGMTVEKAESLLCRYLEQEAAKRLTVETIQKHVADHFELRIADLTGSKRPSNIAVPRMIAMYLSRRMTEKSFPEIGELFGNRNHATVIHAVNKIEKERRSNETLNRTISHIERKLQVV